TDAGAEKAVDDDVGRRVDPGRRLADSDAEPGDGCRMPRHEARRVFCGNDGGGYQRASLMEEARGDQRIAAVVARTGHHQDALVADPTDERLCETGNLPAGDLHQLQRLDAEFVARPRIRLPQHLGRHRGHLVPAERRPAHVTSSVSPGAVWSRAAADPSRSANSMRLLLPISATSSLGSASSEVSTVR